MHASVTPAWSQGQGALEFYALKRSGAVETIREQFNTRNVRRSDAATLAQRMSEGPIAQAGAPSPGFEALARRLAVAGIEAKLEGGRLAFRLGTASGETLQLAQAIAHPWLSERTLASIGAAPELPEYRAVVEANAHLARFLAASPRLPRLAERPFAALQSAVQALFDVLATRDQLRFGARVLFSGRAVIVPDGELRHDQAAIPEEIAWTLYGPHLIREIGAEATAARTIEASACLDALMRNSWVLIHRAPVVEATGLLAFRPRRDPGRVIRIPTLTNELMNADFDGDQLAVFLPLTPEGQEEAGARLSILGHLRRDSALIEALQPLQAARYGLALLGRSPEGLTEISRLAGAAAERVDGIAGRQAILTVTRKVLEEQGAEAALASLARLTARGFEAAKRSGVSMPPFPGAAFPKGPLPASDSPRVWERYQEEQIERLLAERDDTESDLYPFLLAALSGARGTMVHVPRYVSAFGLVEDVDGRRVPIRSSLKDGMTVEEHGILAVGSRRAHAAATRELDQVTRILWERFRPGGLNVMDRAMRSRHPGIVFARAAVTGETDPLTTLESRLFVGL